jgi:hypothetical protein
LPGRRYIGRRYIDRVERHPLGTLLDPHVDRYLAGKRPLSESRVENEGVVLGTDQGGKV